ncbi:phosphatidylglycerophosphatase A family protein [Ideonella livida]|uniref:Phosphatidylglycerophosphatase A n=1 Tax=Ideonella livida TaxID=2707176 RepID=A0A7C9PHM8_9BURK|nr:phosphatidylglycerophosphatase A [Ideonella livida]NDY91989.1 phosphatidylglycerophosphatase A [Ideonella livida]
MNASAPSRPHWRLLLASPLHWVSLGGGSGLSPVAPGTVGTLWAWVVFAILDPWVGPWAGGWGWGVVLAVGLALGWWACTRTAQALGTGDPGAIVWDEVLAMWLILWIIAPAGWGLQLGAFALFRFFDAAKPGPVRWADQRFKGRPGQAPGWTQGAGILLDDLVAAFCTLLVLALWVRW